MIRHARGRFKPTVVAAVAAVATAGALAVASLAAADTNGETGNGRELAAADHGPMPLADPDTIQKPGAGDRYVSYGTSRAGRAIPYVVHGSGNTVGMDTTIDGDAMPGGPGDWARKDIGLWAPSVVRHGGRFLLFYSATQKGTGNPGRKCIGVATSADPAGPFHPRAKPLLCNPGGWSIDPDAFVANRHLYVTYRDDRATTGHETAISVVRLNKAATEVLRKRVLFTSRKITWESVGTTTHIVENPSMVRRDGHWWLFYSGNAWRTDKYSTGVAKCGSSPMATSCAPYPGPRRPWFGYVGSTGLRAPHAPKRKLLGNHRGPGGMSIFYARDGSMRVVWHYHSAHGRVSRTGVLHLNSATGVWTVTSE